MKNITPEKIVRQFVSVNKELLLVLWIVAILWVINFFAINYRSFLNIYLLPVIFASFYFGKRVGTLTAFLSFLMVLLLGLNPEIFSAGAEFSSLNNFIDLTTWGSFLVVTGYTIGVLHERNQKAMQQLRETYYGVLEILNTLLSNDKYTQSHSHRTAYYAVRIARKMRLSDERIEDVRAAALLHDIGKLDVSRSLLYKAAKLTEEEYNEMKQHTVKGLHFLNPVGGTLRRIIPIVLAHHEKPDGSGYEGKKNDEIPLEAKIIAAADVYDALTSDRPYRKALPPWEVKESIVKGSGKEFDTEVVKAFVHAFEEGDLELPASLDNIV